MQLVEVTTKQQAEELIRICPEVIAIDTEYVPGDPRTTTLTSFIIADEDRAWIIFPPLLTMLTSMIQARKAIFLQDWQHCDTIILLQHGCDLRQTNCYNLIDMVHLIDENLPKALGERVKLEFNDSYKDRLKGQFDDLEYQMKDGIYTYRLGIRDLRKLEELNLIQLYEHVRETDRTLLNTTINGILVDEPLMRRTKLEMESKINDYLPKLREEFRDAVTVWELNKWTEEIRKRKSDKGRNRVPRPEFSFASDKQISWLLYEYFRLPIQEKTKKGNPSTSYETLKLLSEGHPGLQTLVEYKDTKAVFSTFVEGMLDRVVDGRIYPHFNVSGTDTGRISHSNPNMGNLPTYGVIRNFFVSEKGYSIIGADYTQLEVVIEANLTDDPNLIRIINEGASKHDITSEGLGITRDSAKTLNFALQYGAGSKKVQKILNVSASTADDIFRRYWELYSGVKRLKEETIKKLEKEGKVTNLFGRTRHFPKVFKEYEIAKQQRQAYNFLIQGVAGDACNRALYQFHQYLVNNNLGRVLFSVHDEIVAEVLDKEAGNCKQILIEIMESVSKELNFKYPLKAKAYGPLRFWTKT